MHSESTERRAVNSGPDWVRVEVSQSCAAVVDPGELCPVSESELVAIGSCGSDEAQQLPSGCVLVCVCEGWNVSEVRDTISTKSRGSNDRVPCELIINLVDGQVLPGQVAPLLVFVGRSETPPELWG